MSGHEEDRELYWDPFMERREAAAIKAPLPQGPGVDIWVVLNRETGHQLGSVRLFSDRYPHAAERVARWWPMDTNSGPVVLWNQRTGEAVY